MDRTDAVNRLRASAEAVRTLGATSLYLFGSTACGAARDDSDLDLFIDYDPGSRFNAFDLAGIKLLLEDRLGAVIDITTRDGLHPRLRDRIEASAVRVF